MILGRCTTRNGLDDGVNLCSFNIGMSSTVIELTGENLTASQVEGKLLFLEKMKEEPFSRTLPAVSVDLDFEIYPERKPSLKALAAIFFHHFSRIQAPAAGNWVCPFVVYASDGTLETLSREFRIGDRRITFSRPNIQFEVFFSKHKRPSSDQLALVHDELVGKGHISSDSYPEMLHILANGDSY